MLYLKKNENTMKRKLYIVSFGDSRQYRYQFDSSDADASIEHSAAFKNIIAELTKRLEADCPDAKHFAGIVNPKVMEVRPEDEGRYAAYPDLDKNAIEEIEKVLLREVQVRSDLKEQIRNAPYADI